MNFKGYIYLSVVWYTSKFIDFFHKKYYFLLIYSHLVAGEKSELELA